MRVEVNLRGIARGDGVRRRADRKLRFALGRFSSRLEGVHTEVGDVNGPRGGVDKYCRITVRTDRGQELRARAIDENVDGAIDRAAERIARLVARHFTLQRSFGRESVRISG